MKTNKKTASVKDVATQVEKVSTDVTSLLLKLDTWKSMKRSDLIHNAIHVVTLILIAYLTGQLQ